MSPHTPLHTPCTPPTNPVHTLAAHPLHTPCTPPAHPKGAHPPPYPLPARERAHARATLGLRPRSVPRVGKTVLPDDGPYFDEAPPPAEPGEAL